MRIAIAGIHQLVTGGVESYLRLLVPLLEAHGHEVRYGYQLRGGPGPAVTRGEIGVDLGDSAVRGVLAMRPDVVLQNGLLSPVDEVRLARSGVPLAFFAHAYSGLCISGTRRFSRPEPEVCTRTFGAGCWTQYFGRGCGGTSPVTAVQLFRDNRLRLTAMRLAAAVIVASEHMRELAVRHGVAAERVVTIPLFVPPVSAPTSPQRRFALKRLIFIGRVTGLKGWVELLETFRIFLQENSGWTLRIVGDGTDAPAMRSRIDELGLPISTHSWQDEAGRDALLDESTVLLLPSTWPEPFGIVGLEAARLGVPTVSFGTGGIGQWLAPGVNGEVAGRLTADALAAALSRAVSSDAHYEALARGALDAAARHGAERHIRSLTHVLESISSRSAGAAADPVNSA